MYILGYQNPNNGDIPHMENIRIEELPDELREEVAKAAGEIRDETVDTNRAPALPGVTAKTRRRNQVRRKLRIPSIQQMEVLEPQQFVVSVPDADDPTEEWDVLVQELSPGHNLLLQDTAFMRSAASARAKIEALNLDENDTNPENLDMLAKINNDQMRDFDSYKMEVCLLGIVEPAGLTREIISKWSSSNIDRIYNAINGGNEAVDAVDAFPEQDTGPGDSSGGSDSSSGE